MKATNVHGIKVEVRAELGRAWQSIGELAAVREGSLIALDKLAGDALDILANGKLIAKGEVVIIGESFGVRVTEVMTDENP